MPHAAVRHCLEPEGLHEQLHAPDFGVRVLTLTRLFLPAAIVAATLAGSANGCLWLKADESSVSVIRPLLDAKQTFRVGMSALPPKADYFSVGADVCF